MASRYWVGGTGTWEDTAHWSDSSGGAGGQSVPTSSDDVIIDASSGFGIAGTITASGTMSVDFFIYYDGITTITGNIVCSGNGDFTFYDGNLTFNGNISANEVLVYGGVVEFHGTITTINDFELQDGDGVAHFYGDVFVGALFLVYSGVLTAHDIDVTVTGAINSFIFYADNSGQPTINMGSGTWSTQGDWQIQESDGKFVTVNAETSTVKFTNIIVGSPIDHQILFSSDTVGRHGTTFNDVLVENGNLAIYSSNVMNHFTIDTNLAVSLTLGDETFSGASTQTIGTFTAHGSPGKLITIRSFGSPTQQTLSANIASVSYIDVKDNIAAGAGIPFYDFPGGVDSGNNINWLFTSPSAYLQTVFLVGAETAGDVQTFNVGKDDNGTPINYELETQELDFDSGISPQNGQQIGGRSHLKKISDKLTVVTQDGMDSQFEARENDGDPKPIPIDFSNNASIGDDINLEGNYFRFKWFGTADESTPILEEIHIDNIDDLGVTES